jgi:hypothetical protein
MTLSGSLVSVWRLESEIRDWAGADSQNRHSRTATRTEEANLLIIFGTPNRQELDRYVSKNPITIQVKRGFGVGYDAQLVHTRIEAEKKASQIGHLFMLDTNVDVTWLMSQPQPHLGGRLKPGATKPREAGRPPTAAEKAIKAS